MSQGLDLLNATQPKFIAESSEIFLRYNPFFEHMYRAGKITKKKLDAPYLEFLLLNDAPSLYKQINHGNEYLPGGRVQDSVKGNEYACNIIAYWDISFKELDLYDAGGVKRLLEKYPMLSIEKFYRDIAEATLSGGITGMEGVVTFNEDQNYVGDGGTRKGIFEMAAIASQTNVAHNVSKATYQGWANQYGTIAAYGTDGRQILRTTYYNCQKQGGDEVAGDYIFLADAATYDNHVQDLDDKVQIVDRSTGEGDNSPSKMRAGVKPFADGPMMYREPGIVISKFSSGGADDGVVYLLKPKTFEWIFAGRDGRKGMFDQEPAFRLPEQRMARTEINYFGNIYCRNLRCNGVVTGGATA